MRRPTINDVAKRAGVSKATVSHVINNTRFVEEETRQRVLQAIAELGYRPSSVARSLTTKRTETIGVIISDASNYFFGEVLLGIEDVLRPANYGLIVCNTAEILEREAHYLDLLLRQRVDGIIAAATSQRWDILAQAEVQHTPIVFVDRSFEGLGGPFVGVDNKGGAYLGTRHLIEFGHRQIGILASADQARAARALLDQWPYLDPERVAIWGWSGGGQMSLNAIFRYPEIYTTAMAIAFISDQRLYDTIYQERYMDLLDANEAGYRDGSPITYAKNLKGKLSIHHGAVDDNVHPGNTIQLVQALLQANKKFDLMIYPENQHGIRYPRYRESRIEYFIEHLKPDIK